MILGGGGCLTQEKIVAEAAKIFVVIADERKKVEHLGTTFKYVPIEVLPMAYKPLQQKIQVTFCHTLSMKNEWDLMRELKLENFISFYQPSNYSLTQKCVQDILGGKIGLRLAGKSKAGPLVTDNGLFILDWYFNLDEIKVKLQIEVPDMLNNLFYS